MDSSVAKKVFYASLAFFIALQIFGLFHAEARVCANIDAAMGFIGAKHGYSKLPFAGAHVLNELLADAALLLHLPFHSIIYIYCLNDALFYLFVAFLIVYLVKRYDYAAVVLLAPILINGWGFYGITNELYLSGGITILFLAVNRDLPYSLKRTIILLCCLFFIVWSHPVAILVLLLFLIATYTSFAQARRDWLVFAFAFVNIVLRLFYFTEQNGDIMKDTLRGVFTSSDFIKYLSAYLRVFWLLIPAMAMLFVFSSTTEQRRNAFICLLTFLTALLLFFTPLASHLHPFDLCFYPLHLFVLTQFVLWLCTNGFGRRLSYSLIVLFFWLIVVDNMREIMFEATNMVENHLAVLKKVNSYCTILSPNHSKWFVKKQALVSIDGMLHMGHGSSPIYLFAQPNLGATNDVVYADSAIIAQLSAVSENDLFIDDRHIIPIKQFDTVYYHLTPGKYRELVADSAFLSYLKLH